MIIADAIQLLILVVLIITAYIALREIKETKNIHKETLYWNKRNKTIDTLNEFRKIMPRNASRILKEKGIDFNEKIPLEILIKEIEINPQIRTELVEYINHHEGIAIGIKQDLYDIEMMKLARKSSFIRVFNKYENYINHEREKGSSKTWINFENLVNEWKNS